MSHDSTGPVPTLEKNASDSAPPAPSPRVDGAPYQPVQRGREDGGGGRFWSARRLPALLASLLALVACALLLYDIVRVRAGSDAASWRRNLADELSSRRLDDTVVIIAAILALLLGLWLLVLALTPGLRSVLTMRGEPRVRAAVERNAAALVLRDRAMEVNGVRSASVKVRRSGVRARAEAHFGELDAVRGELTTALQDGVQELGLAREPRLDVRVHRPKQ
ncbi:DUF6286 domain-containing protein [Streptomyces sp. XM4193]|uniref:DUF6286 domain-containing protein n=1 Tax=Streptomyces sp. XM4193 TaxID=2929782 RepID=UPI001FF9E87C|nr:DUF6286 domain-containing protein [Streptomyces sp. XM4193]MCK1796531.1 DUF6286 domain-containing protein [Streptomyces sp. XM4193]